MNCGCGSLALLVALLSLPTLPAMMAQMTHTLETCDMVEKCMPKGPQVTDRDHFVDCLAAEMWGDEYHSRFPQVSSNEHARCKLPFLVCGEQLSEAASELFDPWQEINREEEGRTEGSQSRALSQLSSPRMEPFRDEFEDVQTVDFGELFPMPEDPVADCQPTMIVPVLHHMMEKAPEILDRFGLFSTLRAVLMVPLVLLSCFGFCWGKELYDRATYGYAEVGHPSQVLMLPSFGGVPTAQPGEFQMTQPLMATTGPVPALQVQMAP